ncbi:hypothetical protein [Tsukamurella sp. PLM1]|uniref:hypothetical protein n=1 Tax=Tsukamurella sp. PLM1 TaxID=2929795 RepID=UPI0020C0BA5F|nr:hypothetical protein [Tsukamurella sp. PLM1]
MRALCVGVVIFFVVVGLGRLFDWPDEGAGPAIALVVGAGTAMLLPAFGHRGEPTGAPSRAATPVLLVGAGLAVSWGILAVVHSELKAVEAYGTRKPNGQIALAVEGRGASSGSLAGTSDCIVVAVALGILAVITGISVLMTSSTWHRHRGYLLYLVLLSGSTAAVIVGGLARDGRDLLRLLQEIGASLATAPTGDVLFPGVDGHENTLAALAQLENFGLVALLLALVLGFSRGADDRLVISTAATGSGTRRGRRIEA